MFKRIIVVWVSLCTVLLLCGSIHPRPHAPSWRNDSFTFTFTVLLLQSADRGNASIMIATRKKNRTVVRISEVSL